MGAKVLVILGMHRSGTSLLASWLSACGLPLGDSLLGEGVGNDRGHFEDMDFLHLHERILRENHIDRGGLRKTAPLVVNPQAKDEMAALIAKKNARSFQWGWKEPRTCLFVSLYTRLLPTARYLIVFRHYDLVVDSLIRRDIKKRQRRIASRHPLRRAFHALGERYLSEFMIGRRANEYLATWVTYNEALLQLASGLAPDAFFTLDCQDFIAAEAPICTALRDWTFDLTCLPTRDFFDASMIYSKPSRSYPYRADLLSRANETMLRLGELAVAARSRFHS